MSKKILFWEDPVLEGYRQILNECVPEGYEMVYYSELDAEGKKQTAQEAEFYLLNAAKAPAERILSTPRLRHIQRTGIGFEMVDIKTCDEKGITVLLIEQNANMALQVAHTAYVLETGEITMTGTGKELLADERVKEAYLGKNRK